MNKNTKVALDAFTELRRKLNGECGSTCPLCIVSNKLYAYESYQVKRREKEFCNYCKNFHFIKHNIGLPRPCPCDRESNPEEIFLYLDEFIEELEEQLSKEYSS